ncbi:MAG: hypothetical protein EOP46_02550, partial [Sphingobacteriaceae bacterium]
MKKNLHHAGGGSHLKKHPCPQGLFTKVNLRFLLYSLVFLFVSMQASAQNISVTGTVTGDDGLSVPGVNVMVKGTTIGVTTDVNGKYTISAPGDATLVFSFIGYTNQEAQVTNRTNINIKLSSNTTSLNEVVVVG